MAINLPIVSKFDDKGIKQAQSSLTKLGDAAKKTALAAGAAITGIAVGSIKAFADFDSKLNQSIAIMGEVSDAMRDDMASAAREVAKTTTFSADQAAESFYFLASAGLDASASIAAMPQVAKFAQAGMFDMALATDLLTDAQSALGMVIRDDANANLKEMTRLSDVLVRANTLANASVEQFSTALTTKAGASLRQFGKDAEEGVAVLAALADQGIKGEIAGTNLSIAIQDLTSKALKNEEAFAANNIAVFDQAGNMRNLADIIYDLEQATLGMSDAEKKATFTTLGFSDKSMGTLSALIGTSEAVKRYEKELRSASGFTDDVAGKQLETMSAQFELLKSRVIDVGISIGEQLAPSLLSVADKIVPLIDKAGPALIALFVALTPLIEGILQLVPLLIDLLVPVLTALGNVVRDVVSPALIGLAQFIGENIPVVATFVGVLGTLVAILNAAQIATKLLVVAKLALAAVLAINPWVLLATAIAAIAAGIVYLATKTTFFQDVWATVTKNVSEAWTAFGELFMTIGENIGSFFVTLGESLSESWQATMDGFGEALQTFGEFFKTVFEAVGGFFKTFVNGYIGIWEGFINGVIGGLNAIIRAANSIRISIPDWVPLLGGKTFSVNLPSVSTVRIPRLAEGGIVMPQPGGVLANLAEAGKPEAVIPLDRLDMSGKSATYNITVNAGMGADGNRIGQMIVDEIRRFERANGPVFASA